MLHLPNEVGLKVVCLVYDAMPFVPKAFRMGELQDAINNEIINHKKKYTAVVLSHAHFSNFTTLRWGRIIDDSVTIGVLGNMYLRGEVDSNNQQAINHEVELMREGGSVVSHTNAKEVLKLSLHLPLEEKSLGNVRSVEIIYSILLHMGHPVLTYIKEHIESIDDFHSQCLPYHDCNCNAARGCASAHRIC